MIFLLLPVDNNISPLEIAKFSNIKLELYILKYV